MTPKQKTFIKEYLVDLNATQAAIRAGYSEKTAYSIGEENLRKPEIAEAIQLAMDDRSKRLDITADRVLQEIAKLAFGNISNLYNEEKNLVHPKDLPDEISATIQEVTEETVGTGESVLLRRKYKLADKKANLELLGKHLKLFTDKIEHTGKDGEAIEFTDTARAARIAALLERGRERRDRQTSEG